MPDKYTYRYVKPSTAPPFKSTIRFTRGRFIGWTSPMGLCNVPYAIFRTLTREILIPLYDVTKETMAKIGQPTEATP